VVREGDLGWAGCPGDVEGLVAAIDEAVMNPGRMTQRGDRARRIFCQRYDRPISSRRWRELLLEAVG
jgi:glycosyltransferase involved in cell wall biosynthesis